MRLNFYNFKGMGSEKSYCLHCDRVLKGRSDKRFCDDGCRNAYNNERKKDEHEDIGPIDLALKQNRRILKGLLGARKTKITTEKSLLQKGFSFKYHTHDFQPRSGNCYHYCYDFGYQEKEEGVYMIVKDLVPLEKE